MRIYRSLLSNIIRLPGRLLLPALLFAGSAHAEPVSFDIPRQKLISALTEYAQQTGLQLLYSAELAENQTSNPVHGRLTEQEALQALLKGSGIRYRYVDDNVITLEWPKTGSLTTESLLAAAGPFVLAEAEPAKPEEAPYKGPVEQEDLVVQGIEISPFITPDSTAATKVPIAITDVPQSIQVITNAAFNDQGALSISDIMKQVPSATLQGTRYTRFPGVNIRGFEAQEIRNGIRQLFFADTDYSALSHIQKVEVLKGPGGSIFGQNGDGGGFINIVTKRAHDQYAAEVSFTRGGWTGFDGDITTGRWDLNAPLTPDGALKARFTGEVEGSDTFINYQTLDRQNFGLALSYDDGGPVRAFLNAEYQHRQTLPNPGLPAIGTAQGSGGLGRISRDTYLGEPAFDNLDTDAPLVQAWLDIDVAENWQVSPRFQYLEFNGRQDQMFLGATTIDEADQSIDVARSGRSGFLERDRDFVGQIDITGTVETGFMKHQIFLGGDYTNHHTEGGLNPRLNVPSITALNPTYMASPPVTSSTRLTFSGNWEVGALAFQDVVSITRYFDLMGGVRHSIIHGKRKILTGRVTETDTDITTFQVGGTVHVTDAFHLFGGYSEGFDVTNAVGFGGADGSSFEPGLSEQIEAGAKVNFPWGLTGTASLFEITRTNVTTPDRDHPGFQEQTGEVRSQGAEIELAYQVNEQWYIQGGYAFIDAKITQSNAGDVGNRFQNTPEHQANLWTHYQFDHGLLKNLTLSAGLNFVGDRPLDNANTVSLPSYTTVDLGASYTYEKVKLELFANNLFDKRYFIASDVGPTVFAGDPRSIMGRISFKY